MNKPLSVLLALVLLLTSVTLAGAEEPVGQPVSVGLGTLRLGGTLKTGFRYAIGGATYDAAANQATDEAANVSFYLRTAQVELFGDVADLGFSYHAELAGHSLDTDAGQTDGVLLLNAADIGLDYISFVKLHLGLIRPSFTDFVSAAERDFLFIELPLMNRCLLDRTGQVGLDVRFTSTYLDAYFGVFNGRRFAPGASPRDAFLPAGATEPVGNNGWGDQNNNKDLYIDFVARLPVDGLRAFGGVWYGTPLDYVTRNNGEITAHDGTVVMFDGGISLRSPYGPTFAAEVLHATYGWDEDLPSGDSRGGEKDRMLTSLAYYVMAGYNFDPLFNVPLELLARYDSYDPDTLNDRNRHAASEDDRLDEITVGVNYLIWRSYAKFALNYIYRAEEWEKVGNPAGDDTQTGINNDDLLFEIQAAF